VSNVFAQNKNIDTLMHIPEVTIVGHNNEVVEIGSKVEQIDTHTKSLYNQQMLSDMLSAQSSVFIKNYTVGGLATPSFRGFNMNQTAILWNGLSISSPLYGGYDLSLLPNTLVDDVTLQYGGATSLWGSGAIGGTIHLSNRLNFEKGGHMKASIQHGSFDSNTQSFEVLASGNKAVSQTKFFNRSNRNNFKFYNTGLKGKPLDTMEHASVDNIGLVQSISFKIKQHHILNAYMWLQGNEREVPASVTSKLSQATQKDNSKRFAFSWTYEKNKSALTLRTAYFNEGLIYKDPSLSINDTSKARTAILQAEYLKKFTEGVKLFLGTNYTYQKGISDNFNFQPTQKNTALFGTLKLKNKKSTIISALSVRKAFVSNNENPFTASLGLELWPFNTIRLRGNISKNYRLPTFNDLYWKQGGNPNLKPESGHSEELGLGYYKYGKVLTIQTELVVVSNQVDNWILWVPDASGIWKPMNAQYVWSRGMEFDFKSLLVHNKWKYQLGYHVQNIQTTIEKVSSGDPSTLHKQMIYTPVYKMYMNFGVTYNHSTVLLVYNYVGERYMNMDNTFSENPYNTVDVKFNQEFYSKHFNLNAYFMVNNIMNTSYEIISYYPAPLSSYQMGLNIIFKIKNNQ
jgi:iron complex outermembrane receptor protein